MYFFFYFKYVLWDVAKTDGAEHFTGCSYRRGRGAQTVETGPERWYSRTLAKTIHTWLLFLFGSSKPNSVMNLRGVQDIMPDEALD